VIEDLCRARDLPLIDHPLWQLGRIQAIAWKLDRDVKELIIEEASKS
jgi:hypothetical protein